MMKKGILGLLLIAMTVSIASTVLAAPSERGAEMKALHRALPGTAGKGGLYIDDGVVE